MHVQNTPLAASYNSYSLMAAAAAAAHSGQGLNSQPVGSLEALRATWQPPHMHGQQPQSSYGLYGQGSSGGQLQSSFLSSLQQLQQEHNRQGTLKAPPSIMSPSHFYRTNGLCMASMMQPLGEADVPLCRHPVCLEVSALHALPLTLPALCRLYPLEAHNNKWLSPNSGSSSSEAKPSRARRNLDQGRGLSASHSLDRQGSGLDRSANMDSSSSQARHDAMGVPPGYASSGNGTQGAPPQSIAVGSQIFSLLRSICSAVLWQHLLHRRGNTIALSASCLQASHQVESRKRLQWHWSLLCQQ